MPFYCCWKKDGINISLSLKKEKRICLWRWILSLHSVCESLASTLAGEERSVMIWSAVDERAERCCWCQNAVERISNTNPTLPSSSPFLSQPAWFLRTLYLIGHQWQHIIVLQFVSVHCGIWKNLMRFKTGAQAFFVVVFYCCSFILIPKGKTWMHKKRSHWCSCSYCLDWSQNGRQTEKELTWACGRVVLRFKASTRDV